MVQVVRLARRPPVHLVVHGTELARRDVFRLIDFPVRGVPLGDGLALAEVAFPSPDDRGGRAVSRLLPFDVAVLLADTIKRSLEGHEMNMTFGEDRGRDDLALDWLLPVFLPGTEVETGEVVLVASLGVGVSHVDPPPT